jgi:hypothetical protein
LLLQIMLAVGGNAATMVVDDDVVVAVVAVVHGVVAARQDITCSKDCCASPKENFQMNLKNAASTNPARLRILRQFFE